MKGRREERSFALVSTLLIVAVMALGALAFFQAARMDRLVTRNTADRVRAELAAESGLAQAQALLANAIGTNRNFIVMSTSPVSDYSPILMVGTRDTGILTNFLPLISGDLSPYLSNRTSTTLAAFLALRTNTNTANLNVGGNFIQDTSTPNWNVFTNAAPSLQPNWASTWYRAPWVYLTNLVTNGTVVQTNLVRFAFLVMDEQARLNPLVHAGLTAETRTNFGRTAAEVVMDAPGAAVFSSSNVRSSFNSQAGGVLSPGNLGLVIGTNSFRQVKHLISLHQAVDEDLIPDGYLTNTNPASFVAYADAGRPKYNLNSLVLTNTNGSAQAATNIGNIIRSNLPSFFTRDLGSQTQPLTNASTLYPNRLSASMVDYIDADSTATLGNGGEPAGKELAPYVVMVAERNTIVSETPATGPSASFTVKFRSEFFVQVWNPYTFPVTGEARLEIKTRQAMGWGTSYSASGGTPVQDLRDFPPPLSTPSVTITVRPNEMLAVAFGQDEEDFIYNNSNRPSSSPAYMLWWTNTSSSNSALYGHPQFKFSWNGINLDMNRQEPEMSSPANAGLPRLPPPNSFRSNGAIRWNFNHTREQTNNSGIFRAAGDPRANYLLQYDWPNFNAHTNVLWQGRQNPSTANNIRQNFSTLWLARDFVRADPNVGTVLASSNSNPQDVAKSWTTADGNNAPFFIRNGPMLSIGELGNIFDPAQIDDTNGVLPRGGTPLNSLLSGGGRSLRIGQPESQYWATNAGQQAMRLLDLFTVNPTGTSAIPTNSPAWARNYWNALVTNGVYTNVPLMFGRINVNTAPPEVLSAVFSGIQITSDAGLPTNTVLAGPSQGLITSLITNRPYSRISDLQKAMSGFVNASNFSVTTISNITSTNAGNPFFAMAAMDRAREELFAKSVNLLTTQSRAFRVYVIGQALGRRTNPVGQVALEASVLLEPQGTTNSFTGMRPTVVFRKTQ